MPSTYIINDKQLRNEDNGAFVRIIQAKRTNSNLLHLESFCVRRRVNTSAQRSYVRETTTAIAGSFIRRIEESGARKICFVPAGSIGRNAARHNRRATGCERAGIWQRTKTAITHGITGARSRVSRRG